MTCVAKAADMTAVTRMALDVVPGWLAGATTQQLDQSLLYAFPRQALQGQLCGRSGGERPRRPRLPPLRLAHHHLLPLLLGPQLRRVRQRAVAALGPRAAGRRHPRQVLRAARHGSAGRGLVIMGAAGQSCPAPVSPSSAACCMPWTCWQGLVRMGAAGQSCGPPASPSSAASCTPWTCWQGFSHHGCSRAELRGAGIPVECCVLHAMDLQAGVQSSACSRA